MRKLYYHIVNFLNKIYYFIKPFEDDRLNSFLFISIFLLLLFILRLLNLCYFDKSKYLTFLQRQYTGKLTLRSERGEIFDRNGIPLAVSKKTCSFYIRPKLIKDKKLFQTIFLNIFGNETGITKSDLKKAFSKNEKFAWLKKNIDGDINHLRKEAAAVIKEYMEKSHQMKPKLFDLIGVMPEFERVHPYGVGSSVVGVLNSSGKGISGLELYLEKHKIILGDKIIIPALKDARGNLYVNDPDALFLSYKKGNNVVLTIDANIQYIVEKIIKKYAKKWHPNFINVVVMNPKTGDIIAAASYPFYKYGTKRGKHFISEINPRFISAPYEPGSVIKPFVLAAAINEGLVTPMTPIKVPANYRVDDKVFHNEFHGENVTLTAWEVIKYSDNVGIIKIAQKLGKKRYYNYLKAFGFGQKTGVEIAGESIYPLRNYKKWKNVDFATLAFGHNIMVNTLQLATAYCALVNGGYLYKPRIIAKIINDKGDVIKDFPAIRIRQVIKPWVSKEMRRVLATVVEGGTGTNTKMENFYIGGKTGTAIKYDPRIRAYNRNKITATFAGAFPLTDPDFVMVVTVDEPKVPKNKLWASDIAVPVFKEIAERILLYEREKPDKYKYFFVGDKMERKPINQDFPYKKGYRKIDR
ncbi:peptidoglycan D,D-transpeptidase FtsI family protein [Desulfurobacterium sp.]